MVSRRRRWWDRRTLKFRIVASTIAIMLVAFAVIGAVTVTALNRFLLGRLDQQLSTSSTRYVASASEAGEAPHESSDGDGDADDGFGDARSQAVDTLGAKFVGQRLVAFGIVGQGTTAPPAADRPKLLSLTPGHPASRDLGALGDYRLTTTALPDGDRVVVGLPLRPVHETLAELLLVELAVFGGVLLATIAASGWLVTLSLRPLTRVTATARRVSDRSLTDADPVLNDRVPAASPDTEVGQLGVAFNHMLDHVESSMQTRHDTEDRLRHFIADASHELRTPIASIRGHAESVRLLREPVPADVVESLGRIESEAARMGVLVDDLLLLARLDAGRQLAEEPIDLSRLIIDAISDARAGGKEHRWSLALPEEPVLVVGDDHRLREVITNLLTNARTHTPAGTQVQVVVELAGAVAVLTVVDDGPGVPSELADRIFERFFRGDNSRAPQTGSSGLGLAIVDAVVKAHGGSVAVDSRPGRTAFTVRLPAVVAEPSPLEGLSASSGASRDG